MWATITVKQKMRPTSERNPGPHHRYVPCGPRLRWFTGRTATKKKKKEGKGNRFADQVKERLCNYSAQDLKKHDLLRVTTAADAANIVAEMDGLLRSREAAEPVETPSADDIFARMSAYMEAPAAA